MGLINLGKRIGGGLREKYEEEKELMQEVKAASKEERRKQALEFAKKREQVKYEGKLKKEKQKYLPKIKKQKQTSHGVLDIIGSKKKNKKFDVVGF